MIVIVAATGYSGVVGVGVVPDAMAVYGVRRVLVVDVLCSLTCRWVIR